MLWHKSKPFISDLIFILGWLKTWCNCFNIMICHSNELTKGETKDYTPQSWDRLANSSLIRLKLLLLPMADWYPKKRYLHVLLNCSCLCHEIWLFKHQKHDRIIKIELDLSSTWIAWGVAMKKKTLTDWFSEALFFMLYRWGKRLLYQNLWTRTGDAWFWFACLLCVPVIQLKGAKLPNKSSLSRQRELSDRWRYLEQLSQSPPSQRFGMESVIKVFDWILNSYQKDILKIWQALRT